MIRTAFFALGLLFALLPRPVHAQDWGVCTNYAYLNHFDARLRAEPCDDIVTVDIHWSGGTAHMRAIHPHSTSMGDDTQFQAAIRHTAERVGAAMDAMGGTLRLDNVTVIFTDLPSRRVGQPDEGFNRADYTAAAGDTFAHECPVTYYKTTGAMDENDFVFTLAHEIFHCVQYRTWPRMPDQEWLMEASAEYFAYLATPGYGAAHIRNFDAEIPGRAFGQMSYQGVVFYLWMGDAYGPERVREFLSSARSLESAVDSDMWIAFAQRYFDRRIHMPDGRPLPSTPQIGGTRVIHGDDRIDMPDMTPYTFNNAVLSFDPNRAYTLTHSPLAADVRVRWKHGDTWRDPPSSLTTCDGEQHYSVIWASTRTTRGGTTDVHAEPPSASTCTCPAGIWRETTESLHRYFEQSAVGGPGAFEFVSGGRTLTLNPDHTGSLSYDSVVTQSRVRGDFWLHQTKTGGTHFTWRALNGMLLATLTPGDNLVNLHNEMHSAGGVLVEDRRAGAQSIGHQFSCDAQGLHLRVPEARAYGGISVDMDFTRAGGSP